MEHIKHTCPAHLYATSISTPAAQQIICSIKVLLGEDGTSRGMKKIITVPYRFCYVYVYVYDKRFVFNSGAQKLARVRENSNYFRSELKKKGFEVIGDNDSPVMPIMLYNPAKIPAFSRECLKRNVSFWHLQE